jgi:alpha-tubulin suppressor-like RCC1 family protein
LEGETILQVAGDSEHIVVLTSEGSVYTFGSNEYGQTGHGITEGNQSTPEKVTGYFLESKTVVAVATNGCHSACIFKNGDTYTWGCGEDGQLGSGDEMTHSSPKLVNGLVGKKAKQVACGGYHTVVCTADGRAYSYGIGEWGQLGHCTLENKFAPTLG